MLQTVSQTRLHARFPAVSFISQAEFNEYCRVAQSSLDARYLYESSLTTREDTVVQLGTCAPCLRRAVFTSDTARWQRMADGRRIPEWSGALTCDCEDALNNRDRAVLHCALAAASLRDSTRLLLLGPENPTDRRLAALAGETTRLPRLLPGAAAGDYRLDAGSGWFHLAVAADYLHRVPPLRAALGELRRVLAPGGSLLVTVPFRYRAARSTSRAGLADAAGRLPAEYREPVHEIGWDVLDLLRSAGFRHAAAYCYWSNELGYLGSFNMLLHAIV
jgi:SAM-dependent methyltransferase